MRLLGLAAVAVFSVGIASAAQAVPAFTDLTTTTPEALANLLLAENSGITINSVAYTGANVASGSFTNGNSSNIGFDSGVALTSGTLNTLPTSFNTNNVALPNPALEEYNGGNPTFNASTLTIEFTPVGNEVSLLYVFGSNDYQFSVGTAFNDVFAAEVNGENRALVPGTDLPVTINTVNCGDFAGNNAANCDLFRDNRFGDITDLDLEGLTQIFELTASVTPGAINTLILSIADSSDSFFDSVAFLQAGSFVSCGGPGLPECDGGPGPGPEPVPEPGTIGLLGLAVLGAAALRRSRRAQ
ncbi:choice-of-anchor L family PEP-CTERM protein [Pedomonas mirosovicensis]|uniref:choice-of-anchor L family PEP-CTERM protein n=1 Tax=Pedomonas mirosovicensis TaxID=2908641 RepID=UPI0021685014|nr:choice-of-anchor L domain-containing protein [Pedomonas mirosovicensis]MCH8684881.1 choice-of-anchor L domain-containing protein [Pedomonas mirosovicensis]